MIAHLLFRVSLVLCCVMPFHVKGGYSDRDLEDARAKSHAAGKKEAEAKFTDVLQSFAKIVGAKGILESDFRDLILTQNAERERMKDALVQKDQEIVGLKKDVRERPVRLWLSDQVEKFGLKRDSLTPSKVFQILDDVLVDPVFVPAALEALSALDASGEDTFERLLMRAKEHVESVFNLFNNQNIPEKTRTSCYAQFLNKHQENAPETKIPETIGDFMLVLDKKLLNDVDFEPAFIRVQMFLEKEEKLVFTAKPRLVKQFLLFSNGILQDYTTFFTGRKHLGELFTEPTFDRGLSKDALNLYRSWMSLPPAQNHDTILSSTTEADLKFKPYVDKIKALPGFDQAILNPRHIYAMFQSFEELKEIFGNDPLPKNFKELFQTFDAAHEITTTQRAALKFFAGQFGLYKKDGYFYRFSEVLQYADDMADGLRL